MFHSVTRFRLVVAGRLSVLLADTIDERFGAAASIRRTDNETVVLLTADQSSLRALLTLLWDWGHDLVTVSACAAGPDRDERTASARVSVPPGPATLSSEARPGGALGEARQRENT